MSRITPSTRKSKITNTSGAQTTTVDIPAGATFAVLALCFYVGSGANAPTAVTLDGKVARLIGTPVLNTAAGMVALYIVTEFSTGASKTLAYTNPVTFDYLEAAIEYQDGVPTVGAYGTAFNGGTPGTATTTALVNSNNDIVFTGYLCSNSGGATTPGTGQTTLDETDDGTPGDGIYGFTTETVTGVGDAQSITGYTPGIASVVITVRPTPVAPTQADTGRSAQYRRTVGRRLWQWGLTSPEWW